MKLARHLLILAATAMSVFACSRPPLHVRQEGAIVVIDMQTLGEYPSDVAGIRLIDDARKDVVWEVKGGDHAQLGLIRLSVGENSTLPADIRHGSYDVITPAGRETFTVAPGTAYVVEVWSSEKQPHAKRTARFVTPG